MTAGAAPPALGTSAPRRHRAGSGPRPGLLRGDIEGLRAIAVLMVLLYHAGVPGLSGGFAGVDVFFVISGYLITSQLVREATSTRRISLVGFYARRARRLLPAATLVLVTTTLAGWWLLPPGRHAELGSDVLAATGYVLNWSLAAREVEYLAEDATPSLVQHYWSLSVEEQFYVLWPLLIIGVLWLCRRYRLRLRRVLTIALTLVAAASVAWSVVHTADSPGTAYFVTTTRVWQLGTGALLVLLAPLVTRLPRTAAAVLAWAGLALIAVTLTTTSSATPWPGTAAALPTLGTAAVIAAGSAWSANPAARLLSHRPMLFLGAVSYGLYLWHWPALRLLAETHPDATLPTRLAVAAGSVLLAWGTLHLVENPVRHHPVLSADHRRSLLYGATSMAVSAAAATTLWMTAPTLDPRSDGDDGVVLGLPDDASGRVAEPHATGAIGLVDPGSRGTPQLRHVAEPERLFTTTGTVLPEPSFATRDIPHAAYGENCQVDQDSTEIVPDDACWFGDPDGRTTVVLLGDSKMLQWLPALEHIANQESWRIKVYTKSACGFAGVALYPECHEYNAKLSERLGDGVHTPDLVITSMVRTGGAELGASVAEHLRPATEAGARVVVLADNPSPARDELGTDVTLYGCVGRHPEDYGACSYESGPGSGTPALTAAAEELDVPLVDLSPWVCPPSDRAEPACPPVIGNVLAFRQGSHLTTTYVSSLAPILHHELALAGAAATPLPDIDWVVPTGLPMPG